MYTIRTTCGRTMAHEYEACADGLAQLHVQTCLRNFCTATVYTAEEWRSEQVDKFTYTLEDMQCAACVAALDEFCEDCE